MALFDNVTYTYYSSTLGRALIPNSDVFNSFKLENVQLMKTWLPYVEEREENGIDSAVCMMIETDYLDNQLLNGESSNAVASESLGGHSVTYGTTAKTKLEELNARSTTDKKIERAKLFVTFNTGVR